MAIINPPNTPLIDQRGLATPEFYRFLVAIQRDISAGVTGIEEVQLLTGGTGLAGLLASVAGVQPDPLIPPTHISIAHEDLMPPYRLPPGA